MSDPWGRTVEAAGSDTLRVYTQPDADTIGIRIDTTEGMAPTARLTVRQSRELRQALEQAEAYVRENK